MTLKRSRGGVYKEINPWEWIAIFKGASVKVGEVDVDSPLAIRLLDNDLIGYPLRVVNIL